MFQKLLISIILCVGCHVVFCVHPYIELYDQIDSGGESLNITEGLPDLGIFNERVESVCGQGLWFFFEANSYDENSRLFDTFASYEYSCTNFESFSRNFYKSVRYAGASDTDEESLTIYDDYDNSGYEFVTLKDMSSLGDFNNQASSFAIVGNSSWTIYSNQNWEGDALCLIPQEQNGFSYGIFDVDSSGFDDNDVASVKKGCHT